jgi:hypothetical protein
MLTFPWSSAGGASRRDFLRVGALGLGGLSLPGLLGARAASAAAGQTVKDTAVVWLFLSGGPSHIDTYDPKPDAPAEFRGLFRPIKTRVPGLDVCELLPAQARVMDKMSLVRTFSHADGNHGSAVHWVATGVLFPRADLGEPQIAPFPGSVTAKVRGSQPRTGMPPYVALSRMPTSDGPAHLGVGCAPLEASGPGRKNLTLHPAIDAARLRDRRELLKTFDAARRNVDAQAQAGDLDLLDQQAFQVILCNGARDAFNLTRESQRVVDRYGPGLGEQLLVARRLCEAGVAFVTIEWAGGRRYGWDNHRGVFDFLRTNLPILDRAVAAFVDDVAQRGLVKRVLLVVLGEMGRTPQVNANAGRDHWPQVMFVLLAGGGLKMGQVIGRSSAKGEFPQDRRFVAGDLLATLYHVLGIDPSLQFLNAGGRPIPILGDGRPIEELV